MPVPYCPVHGEVDTLLGSPMTVPPPGCGCTVSTVATETVLTAVQFVGLLAYRWPLDASLDRLTLLRGTLHRWGVTANGEPPAAPGRDPLDAAYRGGEDLRPHDADRAFAEHLCTAHRVPVEVVALWTQGSEGYAWRYLTSLHALARPL